MASFSYVAIDSKGKQVKGSVEADNQGKAAESLKRDGMTVIELKEQNALNKDINLGGLFKKKVKIRDLSLFCRQFVSLHRAGVTIMESMRMLTEQTENPTLQEALQEVATSVQKGETLANSMRMRSDVFPQLLIHMVSAGEASGSLDIAFERMAVQFEKSAKINSMIKKAMVYPIMVLIVMVVAASEFMQAHWIIVVGVIAVLVVFFKWFKKTPTGEGLINKAAIKLPLFGDLTVKSSSAKFARNLSTMLAAGISMPDAVQIVADTMNNVFYRECMLNAKNDVMQGVPLSTPLEKSGLFPPMVYHMTRIGEETGNTEDMLDTLANYYEEEVEMATQSLMAALEPLIIIVLAGVCGTIIGAVIAPMGAMYEGLDSL